MFPIELRQVRARLGKLPDRQNERAQHPAIRRPHVGRLVAQRRLKGEIRRREKSCVINRMGEQSAEGSSGHRSELNGANATLVNRRFVHDGESVG